MDLKCIMLSEISQREKDKYCLTSLYIWNPKTKQTSEHNKKETDSDLENKLVVIGGERGRRRGRTGMGD